MLCQTTSGTMGTALFWAVMQRVVVVPYRRFGPIFKGQESKKTVKTEKCSARGENKFQGNGTCQLTCRNYGRKYMG